MGLSSEALFIFVVLGFELWAYTLRHSTSPFFVKGVFQDRVSQTICLCWLQTVILLISACWVTGITGASHWCLAQKPYLKGKHDLNLGGTEVWRKLKGNTEGLAQKPLLGGDLALLYRISVRETQCVCKYLYMSLWWWNTVLSSKGSKDHKVCKSRAKAVEQCLEDVGSTPIPLGCQSWPEVYFTLLKEGGRTWVWEDRIGRITMSRLYLEVSFYLWSGSLL
jgi:hypothetical protein